MSNTKHAWELDYVHSVFQELEAQGIALPIGDYGIVYRYIEDAREVFLSEEDTASHP